jgi:sensor histidine kinase regulating citrate/malate metabolism
MDKLGKLTLKKRLILTFSLIIFLFFLFYGGILSSTAGNALRKESEEKAELVVQYLSAANERALLQKDYLSLDTESVKSYPFVEEAFILDSSFKILSPAQRRGEEDTKAKEAVEKGNRKINLGAGKYSIYFPIYKERIELIGVARLDYSVSGVEKAISNLKTVRYLFGLFLLLLCVFSVLLLSKFIFSPIYNLRDNLEAVLKVEGQFLEETNDPELSPIVSAINRILKRR